MCNPQLYPSVSFETRAGFALTICVRNVLARFARTIRVRNLRACFEARVSKRMRACACAYACVWQTPCAFLLVQPDDCCRSWDYGSCECKMKFEICNSMQKIFYKNRCLQSMQSPLFRMESRRMGNAKHRTYWGKTSVLLPRKYGTFMQRSPMFSIAETVAIGLYPKVFCLLVAGSENVCGLLSGRDDGVGWCKRKYNKIKFSAIWFC